MKRLLILLLIVLQIVGLCGCGKQDIRADEESAYTETTGTDQTATEESVQDTTETDVPETPVISEPADEEFVLIADYIPTAKLEIAYATENNFTGKRIYQFAETYLRYGSVKKLKQAGEKLAESGLGLIIWDGPINRFFLFNFLLVRNLYN